MMTGSIGDGSILLTVSFSLPEFPYFALEFVVDTGFTGMLALSPDVITALRLPFLYTAPVQRRDDSIVEKPVHRATISWQGGEREVTILAVEGRPLLGTALLNGTELRVQFRAEGIVTIGEL
jgi:clan AA aspartic protease